MRWVPDRTRRFAKRPHYGAGELDRACEKLVSDFLLRRYGAVEYPLSTSDLTLLVEEHASSLDQYADLSADGSNVEGVTDFLPNDLPQISISKIISGDPRRENRLRTTLAHEFGHAYFHRALYAELFAQDSLLFDSAVQARRMVCKREDILGAPESDWMEWQAGYVSGAILMPARALGRIVLGACGGPNAHPEVHPDSALATELQRRVKAAFQVSVDAARVRLTKLGFLVTERRSPTLFG